MSTTGQRTEIETVPVLIVGGSLVGLSTSLFLSFYGIPSLLVERHSGISPHPRAFNFNMRTMEIFRSVAAEEAIRRKAPPHFQNSGILQAESLVGREFGWITQDTTSSDLSPLAGCIIGQDVLEPVLRARALELGSAMRFSTEFVAFEQDSDGVNAVIRDRVSGAESNVRARYLVAADGNRSAIRQQLGIKTFGPGLIGHQFSILFQADVEGPLRGRKLAVCFVNNPGVRKGTSLVFARNGDGFALFTPYRPDEEQEADFAGERGIELVRAAVGVPDLSVEILNVTPWEVAAWAAQRFQEGRVFLAGDSAHVTPPAGAFGANTGIADAYNLAWKLALVLQEQAGPELLRTYSEERQPVVRGTTEQSFAMFTRFSAGPGGAQGGTPILPYNSIAFGYRYQGEHIPAESSEQGAFENPHEPSGHPGSHAAHVVLHQGERQFSTLDLFGKHFVLLTGAQGSYWREPASKVAASLGLPLDIYQIAGEDGFASLDQRFLSAYGLREDGAVLVRPDGFIAWRAVTTEQHPAEAIEQALRLQFVQTAGKAQKEAIFSH
ncbi:MAG TPA: FAD-dependent monooxygenase [Ktedonobacteraceae bacterium]